MRGNLLFVLWLDGGLDAGFEGGLESEILGA